MASFLMIRVDVPAKSDTQLNELLKGSAHPGVRELINLLEGVSAGTVDATVDVSVRATSLAIAADGNGLTASYNLK